MTMMIPKNDRADFLDDLSKRRKDWQTRIEIISATIGDQTLTDGLPLSGITFEERNGETVIDILIGREADHHQTHTVKNPESVSYLETDEGKDGILEFVEADGTKTLVHLAKPELPAVEHDKNREITVNK